MESIKQSYNRYLRYFLAKGDTTATKYDKYMALSYAVRSEMVDKWIQTQQWYYDQNLRRVYFLSMEYIFGRSLRQNIMSLDIEKDVAVIASDLGFSLDEIYEQEESFDLGNGGNARLAACFQDAIASSSIPATAYGLRYDYGLFHQTIENEIQVEKPVMIAVIKPIFDSFRIAIVHCQLSAPKESAASRISFGIPATAEILIPVITGRANKNCASIIAKGV